MITHQMASSSSAACGLVAHICLPLANLGDAYTAAFRRAVLVTEVLGSAVRAAMGAASRRLKCRRLPINVAAREMVSSDTGV